MRIAVALAVASTLASMPIQARAENGQIAAGVIGGLAAGALLGTVMNAPRAPYYAPAPLYVAPAPAYDASPPPCYWTRGEPVWDDWNGMWVRPRVRVCY